MPENLKHWLEWMTNHCGVWKNANCAKCVFLDICGDPDDDVRARETLAYIQKLEEENALMRIQMQGDCGVCKHWNDDICDECLASTGHPRWEYEGLPEAAKEE